MKNNKNFIYGIAVVTFGAMTIGWIEKGSCLLYTSQKREWAKTLYLKENLTQQELSLIHISSR